MRSLLETSIIINPRDIGGINQLSQLWGTTSYNPWFTPSDTLADATNITPENDHQKKKLETSQITSTIYQKNTSWN